MKKKWILACLVVLSVACGGTQEQEERSNDISSLATRRSAADAVVIGCGASPDACPAGYYASRYDSRYECGDSSEGRNMTYCVIMPTEFGFNACGVDVYKSGRYIVSGYSRSAECNPENGASMMTFTRYDLKPGADQSYVLCGGCAEGDSILGYGAGYCNPSDPSVLIPNARTVCRKLVKKPASVCGFSCPAGFSASQPTYNRGCDFSPDDANTSANSVYCTPAT